MGLIVLAVVLIGGLYALAGLGKAGNLPANIGPFLGIIFVLLLVAHLAMRRLAPNADPILLPTAGLLNGIGYVFIARLSNHEARLQAVWTAIGIAAFIATLALVRRARDLERYRYSLAMAGIALLLLPLVPGIGENINGARLWIHVGSFNFQPGEFAKLALAIFFASVMVERADLLSHGTRRVGRFLVLDPRYLAPILAAWGLSLLIFLAENDLGSSFLFFALFIGMLWVATGRAYYLGLGAALFGFGSFVALKVIGHAKTRVQGWLDPWAHASTSGNQLIQGWFAIAAGGLFGEGPGQSNARPPPGGVHRPDLRGHCRRTRVGRRLRPVVRVPAHGRRRAPGGHPVRPTVREAAGHRAVADPRRADLRDRRRRHQDHPLDRHHSAVRVLRRLVVDRQLCAPRSAAAYFP